jgi:hypothetical protein
MRPNTSFEPLLPLIAGAVVMGVQFYFVTR